MIYACTTDGCGKRINVDEKKGGALVCQDGHVNGLLIGTDTTELKIENCSFVPSDAADEGAKK